MVSIKTLSFLGLEAHEILVEISILPGIPSFQIIGLGDRAVQESRERIKSALYNIGLSLPVGKILVNLSPGSLEKIGTHYDLGILVALLRSMKVLNIQENICLFGEVSLHGDIIAVNGVLPAALYAKKNAIPFICSRANYEEANLSGGTIYGFSHIKELISFFADGKYEDIPVAKQQTEDDVSIQMTIQGQEAALRAAMISNAGRHHLMMIGAPGIGKSTLVKLMGLGLPDLSREESLEVTSLYSVFGNNNNRTLLFRPPLRAPHSSASLVSLFGGGHLAKPGEISLAHRGILFLDELPEFASSTIDALRTPLETEQVAITRANYRVIFPASIQLVTAMNPCKCGLKYEERCHCKNTHSYLSKISGPIQDRIDMRIILTRPSLFAASNTICIKEFRNRIALIRTIQKNRWKHEYITNANVEMDILHQYIDTTSLEKFKIIADNKRLSPRVFIKILRVARTIADLEVQEMIGLNAIQEAMCFVLQ